jgi:hypothetical protein
MKPYKILQESVSLNSNEINKRYLIIIEHLETNVENVYHVEIPDKFNFWDEKFIYYPFLYN